MVSQERRNGESFEAFMRKFKRKVKGEGHLQELRKREYFEKPSEEKKRRHKAAVRRTRQQQEADEL